MCVNLEMKVIFKNTQKFVIFLEKLTWSLSPVILTRLPLINQNMLIQSERINSESDGENHN